MRTSTLAALFATLALFGAPSIALSAESAPAVFSTPARAPTPPPVPVPAAEAARYATREAKDRVAEEFRGSDPVFIAAGISAGVIAVFITAIVLTLVLL
jgi:hypothetical protein